MSYGMSLALQEAVFARLSDVLTVPVLDALPVDPPDVHVRIGAEDVTGLSDSAGRGARVDFTVSVFAGAAGFAAAKEVAGAASDALLGPVPVLARGRVVALELRKARARRLEKGQVRRIDLRFRAWLDDDQT